MNKLKVLVSKVFWDDALIRAIRTFFQAALAFVGVNVVSVEAIDYVGAASIGAGAALISLAQSVIRVATQKIEDDPFVPAEAIAAEDDALLSEVIEESVADAKKD